MRRPTRSPCSSPRAGTKVRRAEALGPHPHSGQPTGHVGPSTQNGSRLGPGPCTSQQLCPAPHAGELSESDLREAITALGVNP